jgi:hypothetical protein
MKKSIVSSDLSKVRVVFVSHGAPTLAIDKEHPSHKFFQQLGKQLGRPKAIISISGHWEETYQPAHSGPVLYVLVFTHACGRMQQSHGEYSRCAATDL